MNTLYLHITPEFSTERLLGQKQSLLGDAAVQQNWIASEEGGFMVVDIFDQHWEDHASLLRR